ncbi:MAG: hypothetical protein EPO39_11965 [Candidatus Manganitrophaceae bacterium]|nr:MAG: hypothetical protein EPO39_11965 [Candidatus Manganitrophaceae bacterium]
MGRSGSQSPPFGWTIWGTPTSPGWKKRKRYGRSGIPAPPVVVWEEQSPVRREVVVRVSLDRGKTFTQPIRLNERKGHSPSVAINNKGLALLGWVEHAMPANKTIVQMLKQPEVKAIASANPYPEGRGAWIAFRSG